MTLQNKLGIKTSKISNGLGEKLESDNGTLQINISINTPSRSTPIKEEEKEPLNNKAADLTLQLLNKDTLNEGDELLLAQDVALFVRSLLKEGRKDIAKSFLKDNKDHLTPSMKDLVSDEIKLMGTK